MESDLLVARSALTARNYESAFRLSGHAVNQADAAIQAGTAGRLSGERLLRLPILVLAAFPLFYAAIGLLAALVARSPTVTAMGLAPRRLLRPWSPATTIGVVLGAAACGAFWHQRQTEAEWPLLGQALLVGALGVLLATTAWNWWAGRRAGLAGEKRDQGVAAPVSVALGAYSLSLVFASLLLPVWIYYLQGPVVTWYLPDPEPLAVLAAEPGPRLHGSRALGAGAVGGLHCLRSDRLDLAMASAAGSIVTWPRKDRGGRQAAGKRRTRRHDAPGFSASGG